MHARCESLESESNRLRPLTKGVHEPRIEAKEMEVPRAGIEPAHPRISPASSTAELPRRGSGGGGSRTHAPQLARLGAAPGGRPRRPVIAPLGVEPSTDGLEDHGPSSGGAGVPPEDASRNRTDLRGVAARYLATRSSHHESPQRESNSPPGLRRPGTRSAGGAVPSGGVEPPQSGFVVPMPTIPRRGREGVEGVEPSMPAWKAGV
jgi:hypothetical protein